MAGVCAISRSQDNGMKTSMSPMSETRQKAIPVSIVTLTRDDHLLLASTMESVAAQDYRPIQYLIVNGGARVDAVIASIDFPEDITVHVINGQANGIYPAMNAALEATSGEWVNFMNAGDTFSNSSAVKSAFEDEDSAVSVKVMRLEGQRDCQKLWHGPLLKNICQQAIFYNRKKLSGLLHFDDSYKFSADLELLVRIHAFDSDHFAVCKPGATIRYLPGGISGRNQHQLFDEKLRIIREIRDSKIFWQRMLNELYVHSVRLAVTLKRFINA